MNLGTPDLGHHVAVETGMAPRRPAARCCPSPKQISCIAEHGGGREEPSLPFKGRALPLSPFLSPDCENVTVSRGNIPVVVSSATAKYMDNFPNCELELRLALTLLCLNGDRRRDDGPRRAEDDARLNLPRLRENGLSLTEEKIAFALALFVLYFGFDRE